MADESIPLQLQVRVYTSHGHPIALHVTAKSPSKSYALLANSDTFTLDLHATG